MFTVKEQISSGEITQSTFCPLFFPLALLFTIQRLLPSVAPLCGAFYCTMFYNIGKKKLWSRETFNWACANGFSLNQCNILLFGVK